MASITTAAPHLVEKLNDSLTFYEQSLASRDFVYAGFAHARVSRDGAVIHPAPEARCRARPPSREHSTPTWSCPEYGVARRVRWSRSSHQQTARADICGAGDFYVEDPDGYILCFEPA
jgi:hypothetical protein